MMCMKDDSLMALETGLTRTKRGYWVYQRRIPQDLLSLFPLGSPRSVREYLGDIPRIEANTKAAQLNAYYLTEWARLRAGSSSASSTIKKTSIPPELIPQLATAAFSKAVNHDEQARHSGTAIQPHERAKWFTNEHQDPREQAIAASKAAAASGDYSAFTEAAVRLLSNAGYFLSPDSREVQELCRELAKHNQRYIQTQFKREQGEFIDSPTFSPAEVSLLAGHAPGEAPSVSKKGFTLEDAQAYWETVTTKPRPPGTVKLVASAVSQFHLLHGKLELHEIKKAHCAAYRDALLTCTAMVLETFYHLGKRCCSGISLSDS